LSKVDKSRKYAATADITKTVKAYKRFLEYEMTRRRAMINALA
jgi:hypothetical protein